MAIGVDMLSAMGALEMEIPVLAALPFKGQELKWFPESRKIYNKILSHPLCTTFIVCEGGYAPYKMQKRNEWMVDQLTEPEDRLISVWDGSSGGTKNCRDYAIMKGKKDMIINIDPREFFHISK